MRRDGLSDACHFVCCQFVSMCSSATGLQLLHSSKKKKIRGNAGLGGSVGHRKKENKAVSVTVFSLRAFLSLYSPVVSFF